MTTDITRAEILATEAGLKCYSSLTSPTGTTFYLRSFRPILKNEENKIVHRQTAEMNEDKLYEFFTELKAAGAQGVCIAHVIRPNAQLTPGVQKECYNFTCGVRDVPTFKFIPAEEIAELKKEIRLLYFVDMKQNLLQDKYAEFKNIYKDKIQKAPLPLTVINEKNIHWYAGVKERNSIQRKTITTIDTLAFELAKLKSEGKEWVILREIEYPYSHLVEGINLIYIEELGHEEAVSFSEDEANQYRQIMKITYECEA